MADGADPDTDPGHESWADQHLRPEVAANYDRNTDPERRHEVDAVVALLAELTGDAPAVELAVGTGRIAVPLAATGVRVHGIDASEPMLDQLRAKAGSEPIAFTQGDMTTTRVCDDAGLVYLVYNTIENLRSQDLQVACFANAAAHLRPGGRFLIETRIADLRRLPPGETFRPFTVTPEDLGFEEYVDPVNQISISHHYFIDGDRVRVSSGAFRYAWPAEYDLMARLAGMELEHRWADWNRTPLANESTAHISIWRKADAG